MQAWKEGENEKILIVQIRNNTIPFYIGSHTTLITIMSEHFVVIH